MLDHVGFAVNDYDRGKAFYEEALAPLGFSLIKEPMGAAAGFGKDGHGSFWVEGQGRPVQGRLHIAFTADSREAVDAFHAAALAAGGTDNGAPGVRTMYHPSYYGGYVLDPDGNNIEALCHKAGAQPRQRACVRSVDPAVLSSGGDPRSQPPVHTPGVPQRAARRPQVPATVPAALAH